MNDTYKIIGEINSNKKFVFDDIIADMLSNKKT